MGGIKLLFIIFGILGFLFIFWRRLKEDYTQGQIFSTGFYIVFAILVSYFTSIYFRLIWWFWISFVASFLGISLGVTKFHLRWLEIIEATILGLLVWLWIEVIYNFVANLDNISFFIAVGLLGLFTLFYYFDSHYKQFTWYRSGRVGFSGLMILGIFFLIRAGIAAYFPTVISLVGENDIILSALASFLSFLGVFSLARLGL